MYIYVNIYMYTFIYIYVIRLLIRTYTRETFLLHPCFAKFFSFFCTFFFATEFVLSTKREFFLMQILYEPYAHTTERAILILSVRRA